MSVTDLIEREVKGQLITAKETHGVARALRSDPAARPKGLL